MEKDVTKMFSIAEEKLRAANEELNRPEEDVVAYLVCEHSRYAIENFLKGFLLKKGIDPSGYDSIESMYLECINHNKEFEKIDLNNFTCNYIDHDMAYCNDISKVSHCYDLANNLDTMLRTEKVIV